MTTEPIAKRRFCNSDALGAEGRTPDAPGAEGRTPDAPGARPCASDAAPHADCFVPGADVSPSFARGSTAIGSRTAPSPSALGGARGATGESAGSAMDWQRANGGALPGDYPITEFEWEISAGVFERPAAADLGRGAGCLAHLRRSRCPLGLLELPVGSFGIEPA
jgi:hypothetical protein